MDLDVLISKTDDPVPLWFYRELKNLIREERRSACEEMLKVIVPEEDTGDYSDEKVVWNNCRSEVIRNGKLFIKGM